MDNPPIAHLIGGGDVGTGNVRFWRLHRGTPQGVKAHSEGRGGPHQKGRRRGHFPTNISTMWNTSGARHRRTDYWNRLVRCSIFPSTYSITWPSACRLTSND